MSERDLVLAKMTGQYKADLLSLVCTSMMCTKALQHPAARPMLETLARMVDARAQELGYSAFDLIDAERGIEQAGTILEHLGAIPTDEEIDGQLQASVLTGEVLFKARNSSRAVVPVKTKGLIDWSEVSCTAVVMSVIVMTQCTTLARYTPNFRHTPARCSIPATTPPSSQLAKWKGCIA